LFKKNSKTNSVKSDYKGFLTKKEIIETVIILLFNFYCL